jgi:hypothetical protein
MCRLENAVERPWLSPIAKMGDILPQKCGIDFFGAIRAAKHSLIHLNGGGSGIRTHGAFLLTAFREPRTRPDYAIPPPKLYHRTPKRGK